MLRVAGPLTLAEVRGHDLIRMLSRDGKPTGLGDAFATYGRILKTLHLLQFVSDERCRRMIGAQLNVTEARHRPRPEDLLRTARLRQLRDPHTDEDDDDCGQE
ncbi:Tn3 family transposase [Streptomyces pseudovenezuelae]|uniref:Tn3 family transposase n=1 Tax=Streptomyces pseudovenezuelae TaxID=67350 RepID=UPI003723EF17